MTYFEISFVILQDILIYLKISCFDLAVFRYLARFKISSFVFRYLKMAKDIFWSRPGLGGPCCFAAAATAAAASCACSHSLLVQTNVSNAFRVHDSISRSSSHSYGAQTPSGQVVCQT